MLPSFGKIVADRDKANSALIKRMVGEIEPIVADIPAHFIHEGDATQIIRSSGEHDETQIAKMEGYIEIRAVPLDEFAMADVNAKLREIATQFAKSAAQNILQTISDAAEKVGNVVDARGRKMSEELLLETLSSMSHSFDEDGRWQAPTMAVGPDLMKQIIELKNSQTLEQKAKYDREIARVISIKKAEHDSEQAGRILAG
jgi:hypothetical protein